MTALHDPMTATRSLNPFVSLGDTATRNTTQVRRFALNARRVPAVPPPSRFAACLRRCAAAGLRLVVTTPTDTATFSRGLARFPQRRIDVGAHIQWETAYRIFTSCSRRAHDRGSWRILVVDRDDRVVGAITARFFCGDVQPQYLHVLSLLGMTGPVFREHCELAVAELIASSVEAGRTPAEISHWAVAPVWHAGLIAVTLLRAMAALVSAFDAPAIVMAADNRRGEVNRLMRMGCTPLCVDGHSCLPPFVHHETGAWLRLLVLDAGKRIAREGEMMAADLALLRQRAAIVSSA